MNDDRDDDGQQQEECWHEMEQDNLEALDRCAKAGARFDDLYFIAAQLGVGERFRKEHARS